MNAAQLPGNTLSGTVPPTLPELFAGQADRTPDAAAVLDGPRTTTYRDLAHAAGRTARVLRSHGVGPGSLVAVCLPRGTELIATLLGVWQAGASYLPLDAGHPHERLRSLTAQAGAGLVVTTAGLRGPLGEGGPRVLTTEDLTTTDPSDPADPAPADPATLAYTIFTSGSTGAPKGVQISHEGIANRVAWAVRAQRLSPGDRILFKTSVGFDAAGWEIFAPLVCGASVVVAPDGTEKDAAALLEAVADNGVTVLQLVPSVLRLLVEEPSWEGCGALRLLASAGEPLHAELVERVRALAGPDLEVWNTYGPTECSIDITAHKVDPAQKTGPVPIGRPLTGMRVLVLGPDGSLAPKGVTGELYAGGVGVALGYAGRPGLTAERFVPDPYGPPGARLYRTGDLVRWNTAGLLEYQGRADGQLKVNGVRIEPGEIEAQLGAHPDVTGAAVVAYRADDDAVRIGAAVTTRGEATGSDLRRFLRTRLPDSHVPSLFRTFDELPLTPNGKIDRAALTTALEQGDDLTGQGAYVAPRNAAEEKVAEVWAALLGREKIGATDDFFALGGTSLQLTRLAARLRATGVTLSMRGLFSATTVEAQARLIGAQDEDNAPIPATDRKGRLPLSSGQRRLWFLDRMNPGSREWVAPLILRLPAATTPDQLRSALTVLGDRHEALRTRYVDEGGEPRQVIGAAVPVELRVVDTGRERLAEHFEAQFARGFELATGRLWRVLLARIPGEDHVLLVTLHHIACDGWSTVVLERELQELCAAAREGRDPVLPAVAVQYADYAAWQSGRQTEEFVAGELAHWRTALDGIAPLDLPADRPRPAERDPRGSVVPIRVEPELAAAVEELSRKNAATPFMTLLTAFATVLARQTGRWDVPVGTPVAGRTRPELSGTVGFFLNSLVVRCGLSPQLRFEEALGRVRAAATAAFAHQELPFDRLVDEISPERDLSRTPLYQVAFDMHSEGVTSIATDAADLRAFADAWTVAKTDLSVFIGRSADGALEGVLEYAVSLFDRATVERVREQFVRLLEEVTADPSACLAEIPLLSGADRRLIATEWNATAADFGDATVCARFEEQAARTPEAPAIGFAGEVVTYAQLNARANQVAHHLRASGVGSGSVVGVLLDRGPNLVASLLGVWKAGAAYVPIDPSYPAGRIASMLESAGAVTALTHSAYADRFGAGTGLVLVDRHAPLLDARPRSAPERTDDGDALAYVIFTSGSTGRPKGVAVTHRGLANHVAWAARDLASRGTAGAPLFSSVAFDLVVPNLWAPLVTGQRVHTIAQDTETADLARELVAAGPFSFVKLTPGHVDVLASQLDAEQAAALAPVLVIAGEALTRATVERWRALAPATELVNEYGPTEASVGTCVFPVPSGGEIGEVVPIGRPLPNMTMYVLDARLALVPVGVPGELYVGGTGVARGYAGWPGLTAERFVPDPYGPAGARLYRTGDLARTRPDGAVEFLGRLDDQVKIRGYRIEPGEVQSVVAEHPGVREAVVVARRTPAGDQQLVAYYVPRDDADVTAADDLTAHCAARLPDYMLPDHYVPLAEIPLNANGKTDRRALPAPDDTGLDGGTSYVAPRTLTEARVAAIWAQVLGLERVGVQDGFFDLGGHSIRAVALVGALRAAGFDVGVREVFEHRTVAELSEFLTGRPAPRETAAPVEPFALLTDEDRARLPEGVVDAYPMSQVQLGMLVEMLADEERRVYLNVASFRITDGTPFDADALRTALDVVTGRHEMLRTSFDLDAFTRPLQIVHPQARIPLAVEDLRQLSQGARESRVRDIMGEERTRGLDLAAAPLLRMTAQVEADDSWRLVVTVSHAITEGWSHRALLMELLDVYRALREGRDPAPAEAPPVRYADFIAAELASLESAEDRSYWQDVIGRYAPFALPADWSGDTGAPSEKYRLAVPVHDLEPRLRALATQARVSFKSVLLAAHLKVMSTLTEEDGFFSGLVCSARPESPGAERVYGMYLNTLPFAFDRTAGSWTDLARQVFAREAEVWDRRRFPMPVIQREAAAGRLLHVRFSYQDFDHVDDKIVDTGASGGEGGTEFALAVSAVSGHLLLTTHIHALDRTRGELLASLYRRVLEAMAADPQGSAQDTCLPEQERERLLAGNDTAADFPAGTVLQRFEEQAARTPDAVAVRYAGGELSYAELDARATRFAYRLRAAGVDAESTVGVLLDRGPDLLATLLAVWKAGGAYVPIDPSYPAERIASMCESAAASLAVTQEGRADRFPGTVEVLDVADLADGNGEYGAVSRVDDPERLAYVIFTSGSTGRPKGVQVPHRGLANHVAWAADELAVRGTGGAPLFSSVAFDLVVPNLWGPLVTGQAVHVVPQDTLPADLPAALLDGGPYSFVKLTPGHLDILTEQLTTEQVDRLSRVYVVAGEALPGATANRALEVLGAGRMINEYGPTEASVGSTIHPVTDHVVPDVVPIGRPLPNMTAYVLDAAMREVPTGVVGELYVGGAGVARGYAGRPDLTAERFLPDPYGPAGSRLYRTGDRVRMREDGDIEFLGRLDDQVKIRGYRVELGEVQAVLAAHPAVRDAVVAVHEPTPGDKRLVAYLVPAEGRELPDAAALAEDCGTLLPEYMVPSAFVALAAIPLNTNGKVDRKALAAPERSAMRAGREFVAPRTDTERTLAKIWSEVLGVDEIGVHDEFFELGGHSILMIQVLAAARREGLAVSVWRMYQHGTLVDLAAAIDEDRAAAAAEEAAKAAEAEPAPVQVPAELLASLLEQAAGGDATRLAEGPLAQVAALLGNGTPAVAAAGEAVALDDLESLMAEHQVPGVSLALLGADGSVRTHTAGVLAVDTDRPVTPQTLFQVGSISKHVTAFATLRLVAEGRVALDDSIDAHLTSWHLDELDAAPGAVTVRHLLGHTAGLARHRSVGFPPGGEVPTLRDLLEGTGAVSTPRVRRQLVPGSTFRKSSTHYWVLQQLLEDVTGEPFQDLAHRLVLAPLGMTGSSFDQDFPRTSGRPVALGHHVNGVAMEGGWRERAHLAAAGLWTTAEDIAKLARQVRASLLGHDGALLPRAVAQELLATHPGSFYGLGTIVDDTGSDAEFGHGGEPAGYWNLSLSHLGSGVGLVALTNSDSGKGVVRHLTARLGKAEEVFGRGELMADWAAAGTGSEAPAGHPLLSPVVTDEERA